jgi:hypothetical protein
MAFYLRQMPARKVHEETEGIEAVTVYLDFKFPITRLIGH